MTPFTPLIPAEEPLETVKEKKAQVVQDSGREEHPSSPPSLKTGHELGSQDCCTHRPPAGVTPAGQTLTVVSPTAGTEERHPQSIDREYCHPLSRNQESRPPKSCHPESYKPDPLYQESRYQDPRQAEFYGSWKNPVGKPWAPRDELHAIEVWAESARRTLASSHSIENGRNLLWSDATTWAERFRASSQNCALKNLYDTGGPLHAKLNRVGPAWTEWVSGSVPDTCPPTDRPGAQCGHGATSTPSGCHENPGYAGGSPLRAKQERFDSTLDLPSVSQDESSLRNVQNYCTLAVSSQQNFNLCSSTLTDASERDCHLSLSSLSRSPPRSLELSSSSLNENSRVNFHSSSLSSNSSVGDRLSTLSLNSDSAAQNFYFATSSRARKSKKKNTSFSSVNYSKGRRVEHWSPYPILGPNVRSFSDSYLNQCIPYPTGAMTRHESCVSSVDAEAAKCLPGPTNHCLLQVPSSGEGSHHCLAAGMSQDCRAALRDMRPSIGEAGVSHDDKRCGGPLSCECYREYSSSRTTSSSTPPLSTTPWRPRTESRGRDHIPRSACGTPTLDRHSPYPRSAGGSPRPPLLSFHPGSSDSIQDLPLSRMTSSPSIFSPTAANSCPYNGVGAGCQSTMRSKPGVPMVCHWKSCGHKFRTQHDLALHVNEDHVRLERPDGDFQCLWRGCPRLGKGFNARYKMLIHIRTHTNEKPHRCAVCSKCFSRLENLKIHMRSHTGEKPYMCTYPGCQKAYSNSSDRFKHVRTHQEDKPYKCKMPGCRKQYTDPSSLRKHVRTHGHSIGADGLVLRRAVSSGDDKVWKWRSGLEPPLSGTSARRHSLDAHNSELYGVEPLLEEDHCHEEGLSIQSSIEMYSSLELKNGIHQALTSTSSTSITTAGEGHVSSPSPYVHHSDAADIEGGGRDLSPPRTQQQQQQQQQRSEVYSKGTSENTGVIEVPVLPAGSTHDQSAGEQGVTSRKVNVPTIVIHEPTPCWIGDRFRTDSERYTGPLENGDKRIPRKECGKRDGRENHQERFTSKDTGWSSSRANSTLQSTNSIPTLSPHSSLSCSPLSADVPPSHGSVHPSSQPRIPTILSPPISPKSSLPAPSWPENPSSSLPVKSPSFDHQSPSKQLRVLLSSDTLTPPSKSSSVRSSSDSPTSTTCNPSSIKPPKTSGTKHWKKRNILRRERELSPAQVPTPHPEESEKPCTVTRESPPTNCRVSTASRSPPTPPAVSPLIPVSTTSSPLHQPPGHSPFLSFHHSQHSLPSSLSSSPMSSSSNVSHPHAPCPIYSSMHILSPSPLRSLYRLGGGGLAPPTSSFLNSFLAPPLPPFLMGERKTSSGVWDSAPLLRPHPLLADFSPCLPSLGARVDSSSVHPSGMFLYQDLPLDLSSLHPLPSQQRPIPASLPLDVLYPGMMNS